MKIKFLSLKMQDEADKIDALHWGMLISFIIAILCEFLTGENGFFYSIFKVALASGSFYLFTVMKDRLYYSFWTFSSIVLIYFITGVLNSTSGVTCFIYLCSTIILSLEMYLLSSPIFYPRVNWWEYDFRYRSDIKGHVRYKDEQYRIRLSDLRRNAGCVTCFEELSIGDQIEIEANNLKFLAEVMSKREYSLGRPYHYGVQFLPKDREEKRALSELFREWKRKKKHISKKKFTQAKV